MIPFPNQEARLSPTNRAMRLYCGKINLIYKSRMVTVRTTAQLLVIHFAEVYLHNKLEVRIINLLEAVN